MTAELDNRFRLEWLSFEQLTSLQVHDLLKLRQDIFVVEQESAYADIDGKDLETLHLLAFERDGNQLVAAIRLFPADGTGRSARIGRVVVHRDFRRFGLGKILMSEGINKARQLCGSCEIEVSAQSYLEKFYSGFGFLTVSEEYIEDGIPHIDMRLGG